MNIKINYYIIILTALIILAIETSCDETSIAILRNKEILSNITISQILNHKKYKGVMPTLAAKLHIYNIKKILLKSLEKSKIKIEEIDYISYTKNPGLIICLQIGETIAKTLSLYLNKPLIACDHLEGHIYSTLLEKKKEWTFPSLALIISGGHTQIYELNDYFEISLLGQTLDDSIGECLDKSSILLGYDYPGGPIIEKLALKGENTYKLPFPKNDKSLNFSFSGLKSEISRIVKKNNYNNLENNNLSYSIQNILLKILQTKIIIALSKKKYKNLIVGGGVINNVFFRSGLRKIKKIKFFFPKKKYSSDNAAMIGILCYYKIKKNKLRIKI